MILRRVIEHVKKQQWTAIVLDFLIVVLGVFIGIQVSNWNEAGKDRADERKFLLQTHDDIEAAEAASRRVRARRIENSQLLSDAANVLFNGGANAVLSADQCKAIAHTQYFNINAPSLSAFTELVSSGRLSIIRDPRLRSALVTYHQARDSLVFYMSYHAIGAHDLPSKYPSLISLTPYFDESLREIQSNQTCDQAAMRNNAAFMNDLTENLDRYDAYVRDGLGPWSDQLEDVHSLLDAALNIHHGSKE